MEKYNNWKLKFYTIWAGQAVSLITSAILQMAIIFYLTEKTGSAMVLSMASLVGFLPYAVFGPAIGVLVDRHEMWGGISTNVLKAKDSLVKRQPDCWIIFSERRAHGVSMDLWKMTISAPNAYANVLVCAAKDVSKSL